MDFFKTILFSALHNAVAVAAPPLIDAAVTAVTNGPQGGAATYAAAHPWVLGAWGIASFVLRDALKSVPAFGAASTAPEVRSPASAIAPPAER